VLTNIFHRFKPRF